MTIVSAILFTATATPLTDIAAKYNVQLFAPLKIATDASGLRGVYAEKAVRRGDKLLSVPLSSCVYVERGADDDIELAFALLDAIDDGATPWSAYKTNVLPESTGAAFAWASADQIDALQLPSTIECCQGLRDRCEAVATDEDYPGDDPDAFRWAFSIVYSRSFNVEMPSPSAPALRMLAPLLDMFNHLPESPSEYASNAADWEADGYDEPPSPWRSEDALLSLHADRDASEGEELRLPYGIETSAELLITSGFVPLPINSADYIPLWADLVELIATCSDNDGGFGLSDAQQQKRLSILSKMDAVDAPLAARPGGLSASKHVLNCVKLVAASDEELDCFEEQYDEAVGHYTPMLVSGSVAPQREKALDALAAEVCAKAAEAMLEELPTSLEEDEALAKECDKEEAESWAEMALTYRIASKRLLAEFAGEWKEL